MGPIAVVSFISKVKGNAEPSKQAFLLLEKGSIDPRGELEITGSSVYCKAADREKHNCDNITLEDASILVNPADGDVNKDGFTDSRDALLVLQHVVLLLPTLPNRDRADVSLDGVVDVLDVLLMLQFDAGLLPGLPFSPAGAGGALGGAWDRLW